MKQAWFTKKRTQYLDLERKLHQKSRAYSWYRIAAFIFFAIILILAINIRSMTLLAINFIWFPLAFGILVKYHNKVRREMLLYRTLADMNADEVKRLRLELSDFPAGEEFLDPSHPYSQDLDLFGRHSLYQLINRTVTHHGQMALVEAMLNRVSPDEIEARQIAVSELSDHPDWLQHFLAAGKVYHARGQNPKALLDWLNQHGDPEIPRWYRPVLVLLPAISLTVTVAFFAGALAFSWLFLVLVINGSILYAVHRSSEDTYEKTHGSLKVLSTYKVMISQIEDRQFVSPLLVALSQPFSQTDFSASEVIGQLQGILNRIEIRRNNLYWLFNIILLLDLLWLIQAARWKSRYRAYVSQWFNSIGSYEFLSSLALTSFAHPHWVTPELTKEHYHLDSLQLGHPLIPDLERICNDFTLRGRGAITVLTGSNMSGKSTFLRTVGTNSVLAYMGGNCCATKLSLGEFQVFTSMRTTDSLEEHASSFYAELKRLNQLIVALEEGIPTLILLDEILKGTNSHDRHRGASALIRQLTDSPAFGLVSTHDLALGSLAEELTSINNYSFNSKLREGELIFDYRLTPGICNSFNASQLMAQMGIAMERADPGVDGI